MNVVLDNNALVYLLNPNARRDVKARLRGLLAEVESSRGQVLIPTPVLTEYLSHATEHALRQALMDRLRASRWVGVVPFDELAAVEAADLHIRAMREGSKRAPLEATTAWQSVKIDRQIVAIAKVRTAMVVSGDDDVLTVAKWASIVAVKAQDLPIPESERQLFIEGIKPLKAVAPPAPRRIDPKRPPTLPPPSEAGNEPPQ